MPDLCFPATAIALAAKNPNGSRITAAAAGRALKAPA